MKRSRRILVAWLGLGALLFLQLAVAAYACAASMPPHGETSSMSTARSHQPCERADEQLPKLCEQHCLQSSQSVDTQPHSAVMQPVLPLIAVIVRSDVHLPAMRDSQRGWLVPVVDPPPLVRFGVLRI